MQRLGRYQIEGEVGHGALATVYRALDTHIMRLVAIKVPSAQLLESSDARARFQREIAVVGRLDHPCIVPIWDVNIETESPDVPYIVMPLMLAGNLDERLRQGPLSPEMALPILERVAQALDEAHSHAIVHGDLKPSNILFDQRGNAAVSDFGISRALNVSLELIRSGVMGTPAYMSPEQLNDRPLDGRADQYALGLVAFEMLTGRRPFQGSALQIVQQQLVQPLPDIRAYSPALPEVLSAVLEQATAKEPDVRYGSASAFVAELRQEAGLATPAPDFVARLYSAARQALHEGNLPEARQLLERVAALQPGYRETERLLGRVRQPEPREAPSPSAPDEGTAVTSVHATIPVKPPAPALPPIRPPVPQPSQAEWRPAWLTRRVIVAIIILSAAATLIGLALITLSVGLSAAARHPLPTQTARPTPLVQTPVLVANSPMPVSSTPAPPTSKASPQPSLIPSATLTIVATPTTVPSAAPTTAPSPLPTAQPVPTGMVLAPAHSFNMGSTAFSNSEPVHRVTLDAFYIDQFEVTNDQYHRCVTGGACTDPSRRSSNTRAKYYDDPTFGSFPVSNITWFQAQNYCAWQHERLPTEAEWEYAASGGDGRKYPWGDIFDASLVPVAANDTVSVGSIPGNASPFGAKDMAGNVVEWVFDWYSSTYYASSPTDNPTGPTTGILKVTRGGAFGNADATAYLAARRFNHSPNSGDVDIGFRCAMTAPKS